MATIEVVGGRGKNARDLMNSDAGWYWYALSKGWNVSPTMNFDFHDWAGDGVMANPTPGRDCGTQGLPAVPAHARAGRATTRPPRSCDSAATRAARARRSCPTCGRRCAGRDSAWQGSTDRGRAGRDHHAHRRRRLGDANRCGRSTSSATPASTRTRIYDGDNVPCTMAYCDPPAFCTTSSRRASSSSISGTSPPSGYATKKARIDAAPPPARRGERFR